MKTLRLLCALCLALVGCSSAVPAQPALAGIQSPAQLKASASATPAILEAQATGTPAQPAATPTPTAASPDGELAFPIRAAFYYPWFPQSWDQSGMNPFTRYHPSLGFYNQDQAQVIQTQIAAMQYGRIQLGIASWWGQGHYTDQRVPAMLQAAEQSGFHWALYVEGESQGDPSVEAIRSDLEYIREHYTASPAYLKIDKRFVVFVYADEQDRCGMAERWQQANTVGAYLVLKIFPGYQSCANQPNAWHQYAPALAQKRVGNDSFNISPGFWKANESEPMLARDLERWNGDIQAMMASQANFQLVTSFNEWGEGTAVESAQEWQSPSGYGVFLDALHNDGRSAGLPPE
jgi:hypothetical protein